MTVMLQTLNSCPQAQYPCMLERFDSFARDAANKRIAVFLDYDGEQRWPAGWHSPGVEQLSATTSACSQQSFAGFTPIVFAVQAHLVFCHARRNAYAHRQGTRQGVHVGPGASSAHDTSQHVVLVVVPHCLLHLSWQMKSYLSLQIWNRSITTHHFEIALLCTQMRRIVRTLALLFPAAIVSGRGREKVQNFVQLRELFYAGSHGMDIVGPQVRKHCPCWGSERASTPSTGQQETSRRLTKSCC